MAQTVHVVYEAGPFGFCLARELVAAGIKCVVVTPRKLDPYCKRVRTDKTDVYELVADLDRYVRGNTRALRVVRIPTLEEELVRAQGRQRDALCRDMRRLAARGRTLLLQFGHHVSNHWWSERQWARIQQGLRAELIAMLEQWRQAIEGIQKLIKPIEKKIIDSAPANLPLGMGKLTFALLLREVMNWQRFKNRRQVGGFTGLCGGILQSGTVKQETSITKVGHKRIRTLLVELAWRFVRYQSGCPLIKKWSKALQTSGKSRRKQIIVAIARQLAIDLWKWQTGRTTIEALGWLVPAAAK